MSLNAAARGDPAANLTRSARGVIRWVATQNPFYVVSAGLFLVGLWISFGAQGNEVDQWALMGGLSAYTLLLAATAMLLVRFAKVWDDVRTVLLLVVIMFLATSVTFDEIYALDPARGFLFYLLGLGMAVAVSEGVLRGIGLRLPALFRVPYYLILAIFFLYPLALAPFLREPQSEELMWGLFAFSPVAGLAFLTLLPAIRRGPDYVADNGSPWPWPLYPWSLFVMLALAAPARAFLLCWSMHLVAGTNMNHLIFGPYFLVPFGMALAVLILELGLKQRADNGPGSTALLGTALSLPALLLAITFVGHLDDPLYRRFLEIFQTRLGGDPLFCTLIGTGCFYAYAAARHAPGALQGVALALAALSFVGNHGLTDGLRTTPQIPLLLSATLLQVGIAAYRRSLWQCLPAAAGVVLLISLAIPSDDARNLPRLFLAYHLSLAALLFIASLFDDSLSRMLRGLAVAAACCGALASMQSPFDVPSWVAYSYALVVAAFLAAYGYWLRYPLGIIAAGLLASSWLVLAGWRGYALLRRTVVGLDYMAGSLLVLAVAIAISLAKSGIWLRRRPVEEAKGDG